MELLPWKRFIVKASLLFLTCCIFNVMVAETLEDVCSSCHVNATCDDKMDGSGGKVCNCKYGFLGNGRTKCQDKDECQSGGGHICGDHTVCHNTYGSFYCTCLSGYSPSNNLVIFIPNDGTQCKDIDECKVQGICGEGGWCINVQGDFSCRCQTGYKVQNGSQPFHPHRDKTFCKAIDCGLPPSVPRGAMLSHTGTRHGSVARFSCSHGFFQKRGNSTATCGEKGVWEGLSLVCEEINCGPPPVFPNTDMHWDNSSGLGSVVRYTCKNGFYLESEINHSTCTSAREWERITVTCKARCGPPPSLPHSEVEWHNGSSPGSVALHRCRSGYRSWRGRARSVCNLTGTWQPATLLCKEIRPAISKLAVFRENCLRWKAEKKDPHGEDYTVHMVGSREYQRTFRDVRQRAFSSASDWPELCLTLLPATNYTVNITALAASFSATVSVNTSIHAPPVPEVAFKYVEVPLPSLWLRRSINTLDPISVYQVFVVPLDGRVEFDCRSASQPLFHSQRPSTPYVAAQIPVGSIGREFTFTLGDRRYYGEYYNAPLQPGRDYYIILRAVSQWGRVRKQSCVFWAKARGTSYIIQSATMIAGGLVGLVGFVVFLGFAHVWYCKKK